MQSINHFRRIICIAVVATIAWMVAPMEAMSQTYDYPTATQNIIAFPTAHGFGKYATGGRGGKVVTVTTLEDDATNPPEGSLRWALKQHPNEPLTVLFDVSGYIRLKDVLNVRRTTGLTLAGQSAPGEGICITGRKFCFGFSENVIVRNMRFRVGSHDTEGNLIATDQSMGGENTANMIYDHCTLGWSAEENTTSSDSKFITFQYTIFHEGLYNAGHGKGSRGYGACLGGSQCTFVYNLFTNNYTRAPRFSGAQSTDYITYVEYINNVNYNWGKEAGCYGGDVNVDSRHYHTAETNFVNNYYRPGPYTKRRLTSVDKYWFFGQTVDDPDQEIPRFFFDGNVMEGNAERTADNWKGVTTDSSYEYMLPEMKVDTFIQPQKFYPGYSFDWSAYTFYNDMETAEQALLTTLKKVGASVRDSVERRLVREVRDGVTTFDGSTLGAGGMIDTPADCEGFIAYPTYTPRGTDWDSDGDGMPDYWEDLNGFDKNNAEDGNYINAEGYTALEKYLCELMGESITGQFGSATSIRTKFAVQFNAYIDGQTLYVEGTDDLRSIHLFDIQGLCRLEQKINGSVSINLRALPAGVYILWVTDKNGYRNAVKLRK